MKMARPLRLLVFSSSLHMGGAERQIIELALPLQASGHEIRIVSLTTLGNMGQEAADRGLDVCSLEARPGRVPVAEIRRFVRLTRAWNPDLIQGWMYHGNLAASLAGWLAPKRPPVLWGVRHSLYSLADEKRLTQHILRVSGPLSHKTSAVVYNAHASVGQHERIGFSPAKSVVIPNGFDCGLYRPRPGAGERLRAELGLEPSTLLAGMIARFHPQKDHPSLLRAIASLADDWPALRLILVGGSMTEANARLMDLLAENGLVGRVSLMGGRKDMHEVVAGLDLCVLSSSFGEGFPNVVGEAMASGVPCVTTDVGDCAAVVGGTGVVVPRRDPQALAAGIAKLAALDPQARRRLGEAARERITRDFALDVVAQRYADLYHDVVADRPRAASVATRLNS